MKILLFALLLVSCMPEKGIQADVVGAELTAMQPYYRQGINEGCILTWYIKERRIQFVSFSQSSCNTYSIGMKFQALVRK